MVAAAAIAADVARPDQASATRSKKGVPPASLYSSQAAAAVALLGLWREGTQNKYTPNTDMVLFY